jgi:hypothetical protein
MFLRTSSKSFKGNTKSCVFKSVLAHSYQFGSHRCTLFGHVFSYYTTFSAGYTFIPNHIIERSERQYICKSLLVGIGFNNAVYVYNGSGDSGDFDTAQFNINVDENVFNSRGLVEATNPYHDIAIRRVTWNRQSGGDYPAKDLIENIAYEELEHQYGGWEINSGSNGEVDLTLDGITISHQEWMEYCETCNEEYNDDTPCACEKCPECYSSIDPDDGECTGCDYKKEIETAS